MFTFVWFCVLLCYGAAEISGSMQDLISDTPSPSFPSISPPTINDSNEHLHMNETYNFNVTQQIYLNGPLLGRAVSNYNSNRIDKGLKSDYLLTNGIGAHKLHIRNVTWNKAREICVEEGAHLAIIRSVSEEMIIQQMMLAESIEKAWIGFHDEFEEGDWISVLDEPLGEVGWARWSKAFSPNPDNGDGAGQNCACLMRESGGMDDDYCSCTRPFVCKISTN